MTLTGANAVAALAVVAGLADMAKGLTDPLGSWYDAKDSHELAWLTDRWRSTWTEHYLHAQGWRRKA